MASQNPPSVTDEVFPKQTNKTYALVELMRGEGPMVGKGPDGTVFSFPVGTSGRHVHLRRADPDAPVYLQCGYQSDQRRLRPPENLKGAVDADR